MAAQTAERTGTAQRVRAHAEQARSFGDTHPAPRSAGTALSVVPPPRAAGLIGTISSELDQFCREKVGFWQVRSATGRIAPRPRPPWLAPGRTRRPGR